MQTPFGWEDRIATMIPAFSMTGELIRPVVLIFKGTGTRLSQDETNFYASLPDVVVLFQKKAWIDRHLEKKVFFSAPN